MKLQLKVAFNAWTFSLVSSETCSPGVRKHSAVSSGIMYGLIASGKNCQRQ